MFISVWGSNSNSLFGHNTKFSSIIEPGCVPVISQSQRSVLKVAVCQHSKSVGSVGSC